MSRFALSALVAVFVAAASPGAQGRADFSGNWTLVADKGQAQTGGALGPTLSITQSTTTVTLEGQSMFVSMAYRPGSGSSITRQEPAGTWQTTYVFDGAEHPVEVQIAAGPGSAVQLVPSTSVPETYRAVWTGDRLVVMIHHSVRVSPSNQPAVTLKRVVRQSLTIEPDGTLAVDSLIVADPAPSAVRQDAPAPTRSLYRRTQ